LRLEGAHLAILAQVHGQDGLGHTATQEDWIADGGSGSRAEELSVSKTFPLFPNNRTLPR
jgi:hypothetical protein